MRGDRFKGCSRKEVGSVEPCVSICSVIHPRGVEQAGVFITKHQLLPWGVSGRCVGGRVRGDKSDSR